MNTQRNQQLVQDTERVLRAIGRVVVAFQLLELWVAEALAQQLNMNAIEDRHLVSAAMSYKQKVDLLFELYRRHGTPSALLSPDVAKRAMCAAEQFRNRVVHSVWAISGSKDSKWVRTKASLRGRGGLDVATRPAQAKLLEQAAQAISEIRNWEEGNASELLQAIKILSTLEADA